MQKQPTTISRSAAASTSAVSWVRERMPSICTPRQRAAERLGIQRLGQPLDLGIAVGLEQADRRIVHALEQQEADLLLGQR